MQNTKRAGRTEPEPLDPGGPGFADDGEGFDDAEGFEVRHAVCPDCGQSIALVADEEHLPEHALCLTPWNPFGLTVCAGTGRPVGEAPAAVGAGAEESPELEVVMLALPQGLDWRTQPFSHVGGPGSRPVRPAAQVLPQRSGHAQAA
ncbi:hypothetical protein C0216_20530 [Streptomyces globosus]|uniref:Uncharacterized protein n=1 Tax=Streptomyces globosus TaxID=68209 RepID=A0A344U3N9_9ACTN|nr:MULTISPECIES: hypothetical protein [Streptomyces]AXE25510.1 hypothetical protein C0216_20530 [Streptomyces globosus]